MKLEHRNIRSSSGEKVYRDTSIIGKSLVHSSVKTKII